MTDNIYEETGQTIDMIQFVEFIRSLPEIIELIKTTNESIDFIKKSLEGLDHFQDDVIQCQKLIKDLQQRMDHFEQSS